jgi:chromosome segregation protein
MNDKDNSRRKLFEQAAGISKYKIRKHETLLKLKGTQGDLDRVEDLLFEIEHNLKELERQARKARRHGELKTKYRELSIEWAVRLLGEQKESYQRISEQQQNEEDRRLEADLEKRKAGSLEREKALAELQTAFNAHVESLRKQENDRNLLRERLRFLKERKETLAREIAEAGQNAVAFEQESVQLEKQRKTAQESIDHVAEQLEQLNADLSRVKRIHGEAKQQWEARQAAYQELERRITDAEKTHEINTVRIDNGERDIERIQQEDAARAETLEALTREAEGLAKGAAETEKAVAKLEQAEETLAGEREKNRQALDQANQELSSTRRELDAKRNEYRLTKNMVESMEGFPEAIRFLRKQVPQTRKAPLLADIITCDEGHKAAIESYLEPWLNHYVVDDLASAMAAMDQLQAKQKGRAAFLVLSELPRTAPSLPQDLPEAWTRARDLVQTDAAYVGLLDALLSKAVLLPDSGSQNAGSVLQERGWDGIAPGGQHVRSGFAVSGGSVGLFKGKRLGRALNLEKLDKLVTSLEAKEAQAKAAVERLRHQDEALRAESNKDALREARQAHDAASSKLLACRTRMEEIQRLAGNGAARLEEWQTAIVNYREENAALEQKLEGWKAEFVQLEQQVAASDEAFQTLNNQLNLATNNYNQQNIRFHQQQSQLNSLVQELGFKAQKLEETLDQKVRNEQLLASADDEIGTIGGKLEGLEGELETAYAKRDADEAVIRDAEEVFYAARGDIAELEDRLRNLHKNRDQVSVLIDRIKERMNELKLQLNSVRERLQIEFNLDIETVIDEEPKHPDMGRQELEHKVEKLRKRLDNYGEINPMAVQAYDEMKERYDFIQGQRQDLLDAKTSLLETIAEIDETARTQFMEAYDKVRENFKMVFQQLFRPEDECDLVLQDPENPLETRIDIIAKPKGKRPQVIDQLSGGEKTLTAMALLFGLYLLKPAPFCVLDEVDAPLDDANINKYNDMIRKFADESQFILVTHNKRTMARVDTIYGVTMQEAGVSKVVAVDFRKLEDVVPA